MDINGVYNLVNFIASKDRKGLFDKDKFNLVCPAAFYEFNNKRYGNIKDLLVTASKSPRIAYSVNQKVLDDLKIFQVTTDLTVDPSGQATYPTDYWHMTSARFNSFTNSDDCDSPGSKGYKNIDLVDNDKASKILDSSIVKPTLEYPICTFYGTYIQFYPENIRRVRFEYLRKPLVPFWNSTVVNNRDIYNPTGSVDLEVPFDCHNEIVALICQMLGINISDKEVMQFGQLKEQQGF